MHIKKTVGRGLGALAIAASVVAGTLITTGTAAQANDGVCGPGDLCLYDGILLGGGQWDDSGAVGNYASGDKWWGTDRSINDAASSAKSRYSTFTAILYQHSNWRGSYVTISPGSQVSVLNDFGMDNKASSNSY